MIVNVRYLRIDGYGYLNQVLISSSCHLNYIHYQCTEELNFHIVAAVRNYLAFNKEQI